MRSASHPDVVQPAFDDDGIELSSVLAPVARRWKTVLAASLLSGVVGACVSYLVTPTFVATNTFLPPQQQSQSAAAGALASLGALSGIAGANLGAKNTPDEYIALMQSETVSDRIIAKFGLRKIWDLRYQADARKRLLKQVDISAGKKDPLLHVAVTDTSPERAAAMANQYVVELRVMTNTLAVTEAQQRRMFFERLLEQSRDKLAAAQTALEAGGFSAGALNSQPQSTAEGYARLKAELTAAQVKLEVMHTSMADASAPVQQQQQLVNSLSSQLAKLESQQGGQAGGGDYVNRYREYKYQETLFDLFARQYETARVDESREGGLIQVVDPATPPERKVAPSRSVYALLFALLGFVTAAAFSVWREQHSAEGLHTGPAPAP